MLPLLQIFVGKADSQLWSDWLKCSHASEVSTGQEHITDALMSSNLQRRNLRIRKVKGPAKVVLGLQIPQVHHLPPMLIQMTQILEPMSNTLTNTLVNSSTYQ